MEKTFNLFGTPWKVIHCDKIETDDDNFNWGICDYGNKIISIATQDEEGKDISERDKKLTLIHELIHAICRDGMYNNYSKDEPFVEWMAKCLLSLKEQKFEI